MKKLIYILVFSLISVQLTVGQNEMLPVNGKVKNIQNLDLPFYLNTMYNNNNSKSGVSRWYNYGETMQLYLGVTSPMYGNFLFPDSTILVNYTGGYGSAWVHKLADVLDVTSVMFNDPTIHPNALTLDAMSNYKLDSLHFHCKYDRNIADPNIVDTLMFEVSVNDNLLQAYFAPGILSPNFTTDTVFMKRLPYNYQTNALNLANKKIYKVPLTAQTYADSLTNGIHIIKIATDSLPKVNAGKYVVVAVTFIPGYTWVANTDILDNKNNVLFISYKERDNFFQVYTKKDFNVSYILPSDVRYNAAGSWNSNFIPSFAYLGTTPTYNYEHHLIYYKISTAFNVTYDKQDVKCNGGNDGFVHINVSGGSAPYTYLWSNGATTSNVNNLTAGNYTVTIIDQTPDTVVRIFSITQPTAIAATVSSTPATACGASDGSIVVSGISGGVPSYSIVVLDADSVTQTMTDLPAGVYTVKVTDANGCKLIKYVTINENGAPAYNITQSNISCYGLSDGALGITIPNPGGSPSYQWSTGQATSSISGLSLGVYLLTVTVNNCHIYQSFNITQPQPLTVTGSVTNPTGGLANGTIILTVTGGTPPYSYDWSSGQQTQNLGNLSGGTYTVTVTDAHQCETVQTYNVISTGITENSETWYCNLYPNPALNFLNISFDGIKNTYADINIFTIHGCLVRYEKIFVNENSVYNINLRNFTQGLFFVEINVNGFKINRKFVKN
ncbi:MAG: hypothetical protein BWY70_00564 [Bacteroidetes bacterium ADurb.Bin408]|nr:MAG: hypothetical protein BWY70_00564 [Bacteroidetes bacterium ADurb.Bin408]